MKLNDHVAVKLTELGRKILEAAVGDKLQDVVEGCHILSVREMMMYFGPEMASGSHVLFEEDEFRSGEEARRERALKQIAYRNLPDLDPEEEGRLDDAMRMSRLAREALGIL